MSSPCCVMIVGLARIPPNAMQVKTLRAVISLAQCVGKSRHLSIWVSAIEGSCAIRPSSGTALAARDPTRRGPRLERSVLITLPAGDILLFELLGTPH